MAGVDAQGHEDRGMKVGDLLRIGGVGFALGIGFADDRAAMDATAGQ